MDGDWCCSCCALMATLRSMFAIKPRWIYFQVRRLGPTGIFMGPRKCQWAAETKPWKDMEMKYCKRFIMGSLNLAEKPMSREEWAVSSSNIKQPTTIFEHCSNVLEFHLGSFRQYLKNAEAPELEDDSEQFECKNPPPKTRRFSMPPDALTFLAFFFQIGWILRWRRGTFKGGCNLQKCNIPSKIEWDLTNGPLGKLLELLNSQVEGSVQWVLLKISWKHKTYYCWWLMLLKSTLITRWWFPPLSKNRNVPPKYRWTWKIVETTAQITKWYGEYHSCHWKKHVHFKIGTGFLASTVVIDIPPYLISFINDLYHIKTMFFWSQSWADMKWWMVPVPISECVLEVYNDA